MRDGHVPGNTLLMDMDPISEPRLRAAPPLRQDKSIRAVFALSGRLRICLVVAIKPPTAQHGFFHPTREASKNGPH
ncbi:hypothetical protein TNCV_995791 [Trichonephila clavipes]|nr:hypothetical protein TNCV_995791 [Trichonephila clavipes]